jgi:hypothetical protein
VAGLLTEFDAGGRMVQAVFNSILPIAQKMGLADEAKRRTIFAAIDETIQAGTHTVLAPLLIGAWKYKSQ